MEHDTSDLVDFCDRFEGADAFESDHKPAAKSQKENSKADKVPRKRKRDKDIWCEICRMNNHNTEDCSFLKKARTFKEANCSKKKKAWENRKSVSEEKPKEQMFNMKDVKSMMGKFATKWRKSESDKKRKHEEVQNIQDHNDTDEFFNSDESSDSKSVASAYGITDSDKDLIDQVLSE